MLILLPELNQYTIVQTFFVKRVLVHDKNSLSTRSEPDYLARQAITYILAL